MIIRVPATSANIGPGFDSFGIAFNLYNEFEFEFGKDSYEENLILKAFNYYFESLNLNSPNVSIKVNANVPRSRGLGSSATCIVAGLIAANEYNKNFLDKKQILRLASNLEGHPDNVAAAIFGGHTIAYEDSVLKVDVASNLKFYGLVPNFEMPTEQSRHSIPKEISVKNAVKNIAGAALISNALRIGDFDLLKSAPQDTIHELNRLKNINEYDKIKEIFDIKNSKIFLSGSGSTLLLVSEINTDFEIEFRKILNLESDWKVIEFEVDKLGARRVDI